MGVRCWAWGGLTIVSLGLLGVGASADARAAVAAPSSVVTGETPHRLLHFTFDDGPDPTTTPPVLDALERNGVRATFFFSASRFALLFY